jgi:hypothetical protein
MIAYRKFSDLEHYLFDEVGPRFQNSGDIEPVDLFMIFVWKANRAKTRVRDQLKTRANGSFASAAAQIASALFATKDREQRLKILMQDWGLRLPMASAVLTVLYPDEFTVYDRRVCGALGFPYKDWSRFSESCWMEYESYKQKVCGIESPEGFTFTLRDRDRFLWGKSVREDAIKAAQ